jgi:hypothetical protein
MCLGSRRALDLDKAFPDTFELLLLYRLHKLEAPEMQLPTRNLLRPLAFSKPGLADSKASGTCKVELKHMVTREEGAHTVHWQQ